MAAVLLLAVLKPWDWAGAPSGARPSPLVERPGAAASPTASARSRPVSRALCFSEEDWRLVTVEQSEDREIRTWIAVEPVEATGPSDPRLDAVRVVTDRVVGLGFCAPDDAATRIRSIDAFVWASGPREPVALPFSALEPLPEYDAGVGDGQVYAPPPAARRAGGGWRPGRYVIELREMRRGNRSLWFAFRVVAAARPSPAP